MLVNEALELPDTDQYFGYAKIFLLQLRLSEPPIKATNQSHETVEVQGPTCHFQRLELSLPSTKPVSVSQVHTPAGHREHSLFLACAGLLKALDHTNLVYCRTYYCSDSADSVLPGIMISVNNIKRACLAALNNQLNPDSDKDAALALELVNTFQAPGFFVENNQLGFFTGKTVEGAEWGPCWAGCTAPPSFAAAASAPWDRANHG